MSSHYLHLASIGLGEEHMCQNFTWGDDYAFDVCGYESLSVATYLSMKQLLNTASRCFLLGMYGFECVYLTCDETGIVKQPSNNQRPYIHKYQLHIWFELDALNAAK